eukprot:1112774-Prorocentrum_minimum.AAC.1
MASDGGFHPAAARSCLRMHSAPHHSLPKTYVMDEERVCLRRARGLLSQQAKWKVDDFMPLWRQ